MKRFIFKDLIIDVDFEKGHIDRLLLCGTDRVAVKVPLFRIGLRNREGILTEVSSYDAKNRRFAVDSFVFEDFGPNAAFLKVTVSLENDSGKASFGIKADPGNGNILVEYADFPLVALPKLCKNDPSGKGGRILFPYNEGVIVSDYSVRESSCFCHWPLVYPSYGSLAMFPNMICSQMMAYLFDDAGLYVAAHDKDRAPKGIDYFETGGGIEMRFRLFTGKDFGDVYDPGYPVVFAACGNTWQSAASMYRDFFEKNLPPRAEKISENKNLPDWYRDSPLVVSYPVRGVHDMDRMDPNSFFPYADALPVIDCISEKTSAKLLVLLMHWEGTAPWAPPYVWPPYGGEKMFFDFRNELKKRNMLLGVYCSGFGYTIKSNVVDGYDMTEEFEFEKLIDIMCAGTDGKVLPSNICPGQRSGYDICPATEKGRDVLARAYTPLFDSGIDYAQILDQNHGGGQYLCHSRKHGHPAAPGLWMTENMQSLLSSWNEKAGRMILGCESAAAEPFIGNLLLSDNRYELNYFLGTPVPFYAFVYHEYVRNFMGNQVSCPLEESDDTFNYRLAYSFAAGDCMTIVLYPDGRIMSNWGMRDFSKLPNRENVLAFIKNLTEFYSEKASKFLYDGRMIEFYDYKCGSVTLRSTFGAAATLELPSVITTAWESKDGEKALVAVNPFSEDKTITVSGRNYNVPSAGAVLINI